MININVYSKEQFENANFYDDNIDLFPNDYFICINATGYIHSVPHFKKDHQRVLNCYFDDTDKDVTKFDNIFNLSFDAKALREDQAIAIKHFINGIPEGSNLHIYCPKGKSRSTAVAKFAGKEGITTYNQHVYTLLCSI